MFLGQFHEILCRAGGKLRLYRMKAIEHAFEFKLRNHLKWTVRRYCACSSVSASARARFDFGGFLLAEFDDVIHQAVIFQLIGGLTVQIDHACARPAAGKNQDRFPVPRRVRSPRTQ